jgi:pimeloyl-ACP methyl ester carboxylesterase
MMLAEFERDSFQVQAGGHGLAVERLGPVTPGQPTLVFLHEGLGSIAQWRNFPHRLCRALGLPAVIYDRWGFGKSDPPVAAAPEHLSRNRGGGRPAGAAGGLRCKPPDLDRP